MKAELVEAEPGTREAGYRWFTSDKDDDLKPINLSKGAAEQRQVSRRTG